MFLGQQGLGSPAPTIQASAIGGGSGRESRREVVLLLRTLAIGAAAAMVITLIPDPARASCWTYRKPERRLASKINNARLNRGLNALRLDPQLSRVSRKHSYEMAKRRKLYHTPSSVLGWRVTRWISLGENIGHTRTVRRAFRLMMRSAPHRANILASDWVHIGVGTVRKGRYIWSTITFEAVRDPGTRLSMC
ncbi:MAG: hypothetical protein GEU78_08205 [Actinobacteria bacterium]|nr:hypothetical protein [Actinomycetota bacterium]